MYIHALVEESGKVLSTMGSPQAAILNPGGFDGTTHWYDWSINDFAPREPMELVVSGNSVSNLPCLCVCEVSGPISHEFQANPPGFSMTFDSPGEYAIIIRPALPQWLDAEITLSVSDNAA